MCSSMMVSCKHFKNEFQNLNIFIYPWSLYNYHVILLRVFFMICDQQYVPCCMKVLIININLSLHV